MKKPFWKLKLGLLIVLLFNSILGHADTLSTTPGQRLHQGGLVLPQQGGTGVNTRTSTGVCTVSGGTWSIPSTLSSTLGGLGANESAATGVVQFSSGTSSVSTALASGTTATTQSANDNSTKVDTTAYADRAAATIAQNSQSAAYTTVLADAGKQIYHPSTDANARTFTIDSNANVAYPTGTAITFINMTSQVVTIAITTDTMYLAGTGTTGSRSLAQYGVATAVKIDSTHWIISGTGLT